MSDPIRIDNSYQIAVKISSNQLAVNKEIKFGRIDQLVGKKIYAFRAVPVEELLVDKKDNTPIAQADLKNILVTLQYAGSQNTQPIQDEPAITFNPNTNGLQALPRIGKNAVGYEFNFENSFFKIKDTTGISADESFVLIAYYH